MARTSKKLIRLGNKRHAIFFFAIYIIGALLLTFEKTIAYAFFEAGSAFPNMLIILTALILMGSYVFFVTLVPATKLRTDVAADNVYYLGFLYTLTSLAIALSIDSAEAILANFGVAIVSTLIGIAARVGLNQLRVDPTDIEEASRLELADATRKVRSELNETVRQLTDFRNMSLQVLTEGYEEVQKNVENISENVLKSVQELVEQSAKPLDELVQKTKSANQQAINSINDVADANSNLAKSHQGMATKIKAVNEELDKIAGHYSDTGIIDEKVVSSIQSELIKLQNQLTEKASQEFGELKDAVSKSAASSEDIRFQLEQITRGKRAEDEEDSDQIEEIENTGPQVVNVSTAADKEKGIWVGTYRGHVIRNLKDNPGVYYVDRVGYHSLEYAKRAINKKVNLVVGKR